jgi:hypothetical protein
MRDGDNASPARREWQPGDERRHIVALQTPSTFEHEAASAECPGANPRPARAPCSACKAGGINRDAVELGQRAADRERKLRTGAKSGMRWQRAVDAQPRSTRVNRWAEVRQKAAGKFHRAIGIFTSNLQRRGWAHRHDQRWGRSGRANAAEPPSECPTKVEGTEMKTRWRLDKDRLTYQSRLTSGHADCARHARNARGQ